MWKSAYVGVYQLLNWKMHDETLEFIIFVLLSVTETECYDRQSAIDSSVLGITTDNDL